MEAGAGHYGCTHASALQGESEDEFARRVVVDMGEQVRKAADLGTAIHAACEIYAQSKVLPENPELRALFEPVRCWFDQEVERIDQVESVLVHSQFGYAGTVDLVRPGLKSTGGWAVVDFKTQKLHRDAKGEQKPAFTNSGPFSLKLTGKPFYPQAAANSLRTL
jgi:hypothetical protein